MNIYKYTFEACYINDFTGEEMEKSEISVTALSLATARKKITARMMPKGYLIGCSIKKKLIKKESMVL